LTSLRRLWRRWGAGRDGLDAAVSSDVEGQAQPLATFDFLPHAFDKALADFRKKIIN